MSTCGMDVGTYLPSNYCTFPPITPPGLQAIYSACRRLYPNQPNPLQVTALIKYWLGGPDPLDYISMYSHPGIPEQGVPAHWHYVSFGLSDLHGDGRVHERTGGNISGFGFELTLRLRQEDNEIQPPTWPATLMQALARYVFQSENNLCVGDHIPWHSALDNGESRIQHMLMTEDIQLDTVNSPFGTVRFVQIVGVCSEEIKAAQHWNGAGVLDLLRTIPLAGGEWLITDLRRGESIFEISPQLQDRVDRGIEEEGSNLSGVTSRCSWNEIPEEDDDGDDTGEDNGCVECRRRPQLSNFESEQIRATLCRGLSRSHTSLIPTPNMEHGRSAKPWSPCCDPPTDLSRTRSSDSDPPTELLRTRSMTSVHLHLNLESAVMLPLALRGRLRHGRHFTFKSVVSECAFTLLPSSVLGSIADETHPYAAHGHWLQILLVDDFIDELLRDLHELNDPDTIDVPKHYSWPDQKLAITVLPDET